MGDQHFGVPVTRVREIVNPLPVTPLFRVPAAILGVVNLRGSLVAVLDLAGFLGLERVGGAASGGLPDRESGRRVGPYARETSDESAGAMLIVEAVRKTRRTDAAFFVDQVLDVATIPVESVDTAPEVGAVERKYIQGVCLHDSRPLTLIDVEAVLGAEMFLRLRDGSASTM